MSAALDIIDIVAASSDGVTLTEIAGNLGLSKPSIIRHMNTLVERKYVVRSADNNRYSLGPRFYILGELSASKVDLLVAADPIMRHLRDKTGLTVNLAGFQTEGIIVLKSVLGTDATEVRVRLGTELPFHATSQGRIALAFSKRDLMKGLKTADMCRYTKFTITDIDALRSEVDQVRARGWCMASQETRMGINAMSAPIMDSNGDCIAAITLVALMHSLAKEPQQAQITALLLAAEQLTNELGGSFPDVSRNQSFIA